VANPPKGCSSTCADNAGTIYSAPLCICRAVLLLLRQGPSSTENGRRRCRPFPQTQAASQTCGGAPVAEPRPTTRTRRRYIAVRVTLLLVQIMLERFTLPRCASAELFSSCCDSVRAPQRRDGGAAGLGNYCSGTAMSTCKPQTTASSRTSHGPTELHRSPNDKGSCNQQQAPAGTRALL
jgi:hypothetical protein